MKLWSVGRRLRLNPRIIFTLLIALGTTLILLAIANHLEEWRDEFWSDVLLHLGTGLLVGTFLLILDRRFTEALQRVQDALSARVEQSMSKRVSIERDKAAEFAATGNYGPLVDLLVAARDIGSISRLGVRIPVTNTSLYLRATLDDVRLSPRTSAPTELPSRPAVVLIVESGDRRQIVRYDWDGEKTPAAVVLTLHDQLAQAGQTIPRTRFLAAAEATRQELADTLLIAILSRSGDDDSLKSIGRIFQKAAGSWYITSRGLENVRTGSLVSVEEIRKGSSPVPEGEAFSDREWDRVVSAAGEAWRADESTPPFW
jgi:hypothetical protein